MASRPDCPARRWTGSPGARAGGPPGGLLVAACLAGFGACGGGAGVAPAERALETRRDGLREYLAATAPAADQSGPRPLLVFGDILLVVRQPLIEKLVSAALPFERDVGDRYRVRVEGARVTLHPGVALVELSGRVSLVERSQLFADITLLGALEISEGPARTPDAPPRLVGHVEIFGVDTREVRIGGLAPPAERLVNGLARTRLDALNEALDDIPIPLRLEERIELPTVEEEEVTIPGGTLDAVFELVSVRAVEGGIFLSLGVDRTGETGAEAPSTDSAEAP